MLYNCNSFVTWLKPQAVKDGCQHGGGSVWSYLMHDLEEVKLARRLGVVIESELLKGEKLPDEVMRAFKELLAHWQWQMQRDWS